MVIELDRQQQRGSQAPAGVASPIRAQNVGTVHSLSAGDLKAIVDAAGFAANFDAPSVRRAYIELIDDKVETIIEIEKNAKPADVALRYAKDVWVAGEAECTKNCLRTTYTTNSSLARMRSFLHDYLKVESQLEGMNIRIELKEKTLAVAGQGGAVDSDNSPVSTGSHTTPTNDEDDSSAMATQPIQSDRNSTSSTNSAMTNTAATQEKYSTYSRSEVDRMLRQQAENITAALGGKISAQTKFFQEAVAEQEKTFNRSVDKLMLSVDEFRTKLEANVSAQQGTSREQMQKFVTDVTRELEQFKTSLNKSILPSVRTIDEKLSALDSKASKKDKSPPAPATTQPPSQLLLWLVSASIATSAISVVLQIVHH